MKRWVLVVLAVLAMAVPAWAGTAGSPSFGNWPSEQPQIHNMRLVGWDSLDGRPSYHPWVNKQGSKYILYAAEHVGYAINRLNGRNEPNGTSVIDVTDPSRPVYLAHIPGVDDGVNNEARHARTCEVGGKVVLLVTTGQIAHDLYDVTNPANPQFIKTVVGHHSDRYNSAALDYTHKPWWDCQTGYMFLPVGNAVGETSRWRANHIKIFWQNPANINDTRSVRDFGIVGQEPLSSGPIPTSIHMPLGSKNHDRVYFGWGSGANGIGQITDYVKLVEPNGFGVGWPIPPTPANLAYPVIGTVYPGNQGVHTFYELREMYVPDLALGQSTADKHREFAITVSEATDWNCSGERDLTLMWDITIPQRPFVVSSFQVPAGEGDFCNKGGRFGPHSGQDRYDGPFWKKLYAVAYFNGGIRVVDIRNPYNMVEVAHAIPDPNANTKFCAGTNCTYTATQTNNSDTDDRGYIYTVDRGGTGTHIWELTGDARKILNGPVPAP
jgi:hypothetical protein